MVDRTKPTKRFLSSSLTLLLIFLLGLVSYNSRAQLQDQSDVAEASDSGVATLSAGVDLVSRYIWRGADLGNSPAVQPSITFSAAGFKTGFWGSYGLTSRSEYINDSTVQDMGHYSEIDFFVSYTWKSLTLTLFDYFSADGLSPNSDNKYFNLRNSTTSHTFELSLSFGGPEKFPIELFAGTLIYGADKNKDTLGVYGGGERNNFSTYFEAAYPFTISDFEVKPFLGGIPFGSAWYGPKGGITNVGMTVSWPISISKEYELPVFGSVILNPQTQSIFLVFGASL